MFRKILAIAATMALVACNGDPANDEVAMEAAHVESKGQELKNASHVGSANGFWRYVVKVNGCTGTIIGKRHVLTAAHCGSAKVGTWVGLWSPGRTTSGSSRAHAKILKVYMPYGVSSSDKSDTNGKHADYRVLFVDRDFPSGYRATVIPSQWVGQHKTVYQVGAGRHDGEASNLDQLRWRTGQTSGDTDDGGSMMLEHHNTDNGDSGGPIMLFDWDLNTYRTYGALTGSTFHFPRLRAHYTSVPYHFWDITKAMGHTWQYHKDYMGNDIRRTNNVSHKQCVARCMHNNSCKGYTWVPQSGQQLSGGRGTCWEKDKMTGGRSATWMRSGFKSGTGSCYKKDGACRL